MSLRFIEMLQLLIYETYCDGIMHYLIHSSLLLHIMHKWHTRLKKHNDAAVHQAATVNQFPSTNSCKHLPVMVVMYLKNLIPN
jgi:hypothetical protein